MSIKRYFNQCIFGLLLYSTCIQSNLCISSWQSDLICDKFCWRLLERARFPAENYTIYKALYIDKNILNVCTQRTMNNSPINNWLQRKSPWNKTIWTRHVDVLNTRKKFKWDVNQLDIKRRRDYDIAFLTLQIWCALWMCIYTHIDLCMNLMIQFYWYQLNTETGLSNKTTT